MTDVHTLLYSFAEDIPPAIRQLVPLPIGVSLQNFMDLDDQEEDDALLSYHTSDYELRARPLSEAGMKAALEELVEKVERSNPDAMFAITFTRNTLLVDNVNDGGRHATYSACVGSWLPSSRLCIILVARPLTPPLPLPVDSTPGANTASVRAAFKAALERSFPFQPAWPGDASVFKDETEGGGEGGGKGGGAGQ